MRSARVLALVLCALIAAVETQAQTPPPGAPASAARFSVQAVRVHGNTLIPDSVIAALVAPLVGGERTLGDLKQGAAAVQEAYRKAGYGGVVAYVPEQELAAGDVVIRVVEGKLARVRISGARVRISGNRLYNEANIRSSLPNLRLGETPRVPAIDRDIQLANENPARELRVTLTAGANPGDIDANIEVAETDPVRVLVGLDNTGNPTTGNYRLSVGMQHANLWNLDHIGTVQYQTSPTEPDLVRVYSLGYRLPLYGHAASIDAFFAHSSVDNGTTATPAGPLQFTGKGDVFGLRVNRYLDRLGEYDHRLTLGLDWRDYDNQCSIGVFGAAACGPAGASVTILPLSLAYTAQVQRPDLSWGYSATLSHNVGGSGEAAFNAARPGAKKAYTMLHLSAFGRLALAESYGLQGRVSGQYSPDALVPGEQIGLGGAMSVRGYRERELVGDRGFYVNLEALGPDFGRGLKTEGISLRPLVFVDFGSIANNKDARCAGNDSKCSLSSIGVGARFAVGKRLSGRLDLGHALEDGSQKSAGSTHGHLALNLVF